MQMYFYLVATTTTAASACPNPKQIPPNFLNMPEGEKGPQLSPKSHQWTLRSFNGSGEGAQESHRNDSPLSEFCCFIENMLACS